MANLAAACTAAEQAGVKGLRSQVDMAGFEQLAHRLEEFVAHGITCVDDSISTVPQATLAALAAYAQTRNVALALEPLNPMFGGNRTCLFTVKDALAICNAVNQPNVGIAVDVYHVWWDTRLSQSLAAAQGKILGYHLCDWLEHTRHMLLDRGMMGDGVADLKAIRGAVESAGYQGLCEVEIFSAENWWKRDPADVLDVIIERFRRTC